MEISVKKFEELTKRELYEVLKARCRVFVVEQTCPYLDPDGKDYEAYHLLAQENGEIKAYLRFYKKDRDTLQMGRVLTVARKTGLGNVIIPSALEYIKNNLPESKIFIEAQTYATGFYAKFGFKARGEEFLEDGIPHTPMILNIR